MKQMQTAWGWLMVAALAVLPGPSAPAQDAVPAAAVSKGVSMPDTPAGRCAAGFFQLLNGGSEAAVVEFESAWAAPKRQARAPVAERVKTILRLRDDFG